MALHTAQHVVRNVLQGNVQIVADILLLTHDAQKVPWKMSRIGIVQSNPLHSGNVRHLLNELSDMLLAVNIDTIVGQFLGNNLELLGALTDQIAHLLQNVFHRTTLVAARNQRNGAIGAMSVATLRNLQIGIMSWRSNVAET